jgi:hypothetical protein
MTEKENKNIPSTGGTKDKNPNADKHPTKTPADKSGNTKSKDERPNKIDISGSTRMEKPMEKRKE